MTLNLPNPVAAYFTADKANSEGSFDSLEFSA